MTNQFGGGGGVPSGAAGGVLGGTYPNPAFSTNGTTPILGTVVGLLGADVTMTNANQWYDGATVALTAGTWLLIGWLTASGNAGGEQLTTRLWDGTTSFTSSQATTATGGYLDPFCLAAVVTPSVTTTYRIAANHAAVSGLIKAAAPTNGVGNNATGIVALRIA